MSIFKKISKLVAPRSDSYAYWVTAKCDRCGEIVRARVNLYNDLSIDYESRKKTTYYCHKTLIGEGRCFQRIDIKLTFNDKRQLIEREISGGQFVDKS